MIKHLLFILMSFGLQTSIVAQLTVEQCQENAKVNYPLVKQYGLIEQTAQYNIDNANKGYLPQLTFSAKGTYQSQVTKLPITIPNVTIPALSKYQYQAVIEANQVIWDGGAISAQNKSSNINSVVEKQKLEVELYALNDRVNQLYFGILLISEQLKQNNILQTELHTNYNRITNYKVNGMANQSDLDLIKVEQINAKQRESDLISTQKSFYIMLSALTGIAIEDKTVLKKPEINLNSLSKVNNNRPEIGLFEAQNKLIESQKDLIKAANNPKIGAFLQGGFGKPGLNMLTNAFSEFYIGGIRLTWNLSNYYTQKNNINKIEVNKKSIEVQKETFLFNSDLKTKQQQTEIDKLQSTLANDEEIIRLRENIKKAASAKVENGTLTISDLIREINAEDQAKQLKHLHEIQLITSIYQLKYNTNN